MSRRLDVFVGWLDLTCPMVLLNGSQTTCAVANSNFVTEIARAVHLRPDTKQPPQKEKVDFKLCENIRQGIDLAQHLPDKPVSPCECWINLHQHNQLSLCAG